MYNYNSLSSVYWLGMVKFFYTHFYSSTDSILLNVTAELYNLTNASYLYQENSYEFLYYMTEFCEEVSDSIKPAIFLLFESI